MTHPTPTPVAAAAGTQAAPKTKPTKRSPAPPELADLALIDAPRIAAAACIAMSTWLDLVRTGAAPQPVIRAPRCTRWRLADIREWLQQRAERGSTPAQRATVASTARTATMAAAAKRQRQATAQAAGA